MSSFATFRVPPTKAVERTDFDAVYHAHAAAVLRWATRLGGPGVDVDDIVQDVFIIVGRKLGSFRGAARVETWLFRITARIAANHRRGARRRQIWARMTRRIEEHLPTTAPNPAESMEIMETARQFYRVLDGLNKVQREALLLFELEGLGTEEIAQLMGRAPATVRVWLHRGRAKFVTGWRLAREEQQE
jgi:RNA polymerase sigma-70 factor (ECF subfamily)